MASAEPWSGDLDARIEQEQEPQDELDFLEQEWNEAFAQSPLAGPVAPRRRVGKQNEAGVRGRG